MRRHARTLLPVLSLAGTLAACTPRAGDVAHEPAPPQPSVPQTSPPSASSEALDWKFLEAPLLTDHVQLTSREMFVRAGEAYFDHHSPPRWVIFQAVPVPEAGRDAETFYSMYVARLTYAADKLTGIERPIKISPEGAANTCGWFDPINQERVLFGSTLTRPSANQRPGFQVGTRKYIWLFPHETEIVTRTVPEIYYTLHPNAPRPAWTGDAVTAKPLFTLPNYDAECSYSRDGRFVLYAHVREEQTRGRDDADIWIYDTQTGKHHELIHADGYDGGPFFSPDNKRICYRSDRAGNDLLQLFITDLKFDPAGVPVGIERETQITQNEHVNWAPFWHPSGRFLVYGTSEMGHTNYEVFAIEVPSGWHGSAVPPQTRAEDLRTRRITYGPGADLLPAFSDDGRYLMWTAQRGPMAEGESKPSSQVWVARFNFETKREFALKELFLPRFDPPRNEQDARKIAQRVVDTGLWVPQTEGVTGIERTRIGWRVTAVSGSGRHRLFAIDIGNDGSVKIEEEPSFKP